MENIRISEDSVNISLNKKFYSPTAVKDAADAFNDFFDCKIIEEKNNIRALLNLKVKEDHQKIADEFCNYILGLMKNQALV